MRPVRVTGLGAVTALGSTVEALWRGVLDARVGLAPPDALSLPDVPGVFVGEALPARPPDHDRALELAERAAGEALAHAGWTHEGARTALVVATTKGGIGLAQAVLEERAPAAALHGAPLFALAATLARRLEVRGPVQTVSVACASGTSALGHAAALLRRGAADRALVIGVDALCEFIVRGFASLRALSSGPALPFDRQRSGLCAGEGAAAVTLEAGDGPSLARVVGFASSNDANHITGPARDGAGLARAIRGALGDAGLAPADIAAVSAHGTATRFNDAMEGRALAGIFGAHGVPVHSLKGALGHTMGAAGLVEAVVSVRGLQERRWAPTSGFAEADPEVPLDVVHGAPRPLDGRAVLSTSSGFSGINAAVVLCPS